MLDEGASTPLTTAAEEESVTPGGRQRPSGAGRRGGWGSGRKTGDGGDGPHSESVECVGREVGNPRYQLMNQMAQNNSNVDIDHSKKKKKKLCKSATGRT